MESMASHQQQVTTASGKFNIRFDWSFASECVRATTPKVRMILSSPCSLATVAHSERFSTTCGIWVPPTIGFDFAVSAKYVRFARPCKLRTGPLQATAPFLQLGLPATKLPLFSADKCVGGTLTRLCAAHTNKAPGCYV